jgi:hypothetical protein
VRLSGKSKYYNNCDDVWVFQLTTCSIKGETFHEQSNNCRIMALDAANNPFEQNQRLIPIKKSKKNSKLGKRM